MNTFSDIIDAYGVRKLADLLGIADSHVRTMKARDSIPVEHWAAIISSPPDDLRDVLTFDKLLSLRASKKTGSAA